ncbi:MAG: response regulator [Actinobacteria bacterium]|nr:response regulator [Actinomycetota bacterium]
MMMSPITPILVVDDEESIRTLLGRVLGRGGYKNVSMASSSDEARKLLADDVFELMLTDMRMPGGSGLELLEKAREEHPYLATLMVTGVDDAELAEQALGLGAYGYLVKPFRHNEVLVSVSNALRRRQLESESRAHSEELEEKVRERTSDLWTALQRVEQREQDLRVSQEDTIERLSIAAEFRDDETASHINRMSHYCGSLAGWVGLDRERSDVIRMASIMHDVGKIGIPDSILLKPGKLTPDEYATMQQHAEFGYRILSGGKSELLDLAATIALTHHEWYDGTGYPRGLRGDEIPIEGRIAAIADVFDALTSDRVYRKAYGLIDAIAMMNEGRGTQFDPEFLDIFIDHLDEVLEVKHHEESLASPPSHRLLFDAAV